MGCPCSSSVCGALLWLDPVYTYKVSAVFTGGNIIAPSSNSLEDHKFRFVRVLYHLTITVYFPKSLFSSKIWLLSDFLTFLVSQICWISYFCKESILSSKNIFKCVSQFNRMQLGCNIGLTANKNKPYIKEHERRVPVVTKSNFTASFNRLQCGQQFEETSP